MNSKFSYNKHVLELFLPGRFDFAFDGGDGSDIGVFIGRVLIMHELAEHILKYNLQIKSISYPTSGKKGHDILHLYNLLDRQTQKELQSISEKFGFLFFTGNNPVPSISDICKKHQNAFMHFRYTILSKALNKSLNIHINLSELALLFVCGINASDLSIKYTIEDLVLKFGYVKGEPLKQFLDRNNIRN